MLWDILIKLLLPSSLRNGEVLHAFLMSFCKPIMSRYDSDKLYIDNWLDELKYTSQIKSFQKLLNDEFDYNLRRIIIIDGTEGNVSLFSSEGGNFIKLCPPDNLATPENIVYIVPESLTTIGEDAIIKYPAGIDLDRLKAFVRRYVFAGVGISYQQIL